MGTDRFIVEPVRWDGCYTVGDDGKTLTILYLANSCYEFDRVEHTADENEVRITIFERGPVGFQTLAGRKRTATVRLAEELGTRAVIDAVGATTRPPCGATQPVSATD